MIDEVLGILVLFEVPSLLVRSDIVQEAAFTVLNLSEQLWVVLISELLDLDQLAVSLLIEILTDQLCDIALVDDAVCLGKALQDDPVLEVFDDLLVDGPEQLSTSVPSLLDLIVLVVEVLPDPGSLYAKAWLA